MSADTWLFSVCGVVLIVGGWWLYPSLNRLLAMSPDDPIFRKRGWLLGAAALCQWAICIAWVLTCLAMAGEFNEYMFGPWPPDALGVWLRLTSGIAFMLGFVGTTAMWAWYRGYKRGKEGAQPLGSNPFDF